MTLLAYAADRRAAAAPLLLGAGRAAIDRYLLPAGRTAANPPHAAAAVDSWDRQRDGHRTVIQTCRILCQQRKSQLIHVC